MTTRVPSGETSTPLDATIRNARHADLESLVALLEELFSIESDVAVDGRRQRRGLSLMLDGCGKHRCVKVAEAKGRVVAMGTAQLMVSTAEGALSTLVEDLVVTETMRRRGIGRLLLASIEAWGRQHGATRFQLLVDLQNRPALDFYRKIGWQATQLTCLRKSIAMEE